MEELSIPQSNKPIQVAQNLPLTDLGVRLIKLIEEENIRAFIRFKSEMTTEIAIKEGNSIQICYKNEADETIEIICYLIIDFARSINVGKNITDWQVEEIACTICTRFNDLTIEELLVIFSNVKAGRYGKLYDRIDVTIISDCIQHYYANERADYLEKTNSAKNFKSNNILEAIINSENPDNFFVRKTCELLDKFSRKPEKTKSEFTVTAAIPKHSEYLEKAKNLIPQFTLKELNLFRKEAIKANWHELIDMTEEEIKKREIPEVQKSMNNQK